MNLQTPEERGYTFALCNLSAPSLSHATDMAFYGSCASCMVQGQNLMAVIMPQFAYKKGQLYIAARAVEDPFINRGLQITNLRSSSRRNPTLGTTAPWCTMAAWLCPRA